MGGVFVVWLVAAAAFGCNQEAAPGPPRFRVVSSPRVPPAVEWAAQDVRRYLEAMGDDGNLNNLDGCSNSCMLPSCGDGIVQPEEQCDDGNLVNTDSCTVLCSFAQCGDGFVYLTVTDPLNPNAVEQCDEGNLVNNDACTNVCTLP